MPSPYIFGGLPRFAGVSNHGDDDDSPLALLAAGSYRSGGPERTFGFTLRSKLNAYGTPSFCRMRTTHEGDDHAVRSGARTRAGKRLRRGEGQAGAS